MTDTCNQTEDVVKPTLCDDLGRNIAYMRLSLTDRCNFRCVYCMPDKGLPFIPHEAVITYEELLRLATIFTGLGVTRYKITGGEPLCRKGAVEFIRDLVALPGVDDVTLTTNGSLADSRLEALAESGLRSVTFSCDAYDAIPFGTICRTETDPKEIRAAMGKAAALGLTVKINTVPIAGLNDAELPRLARFALERGFQIRFIELMPIGSGKALSGVSPAAIRQTMEREFGPLKRVDYKTGNGPAVMHSIEGYPGLVGFIAALSGRFCSSCNRARLTSTGFFKTCLCHEAGIDLRAAMVNGATDDGLRGMIREAAARKPGGHTFSFAAEEAGGGFYMNTVGG